MAGKFKMGGTYEDDNDSEESDDPLADEPWGIGRPYSSNDEFAMNYFNYFDTDDVNMLNIFPTITKIPSDQVICGPAYSNAKVVKHYLIGQVLGEGSYGKVKECLDIHTLHRRAIKILKKRKLRRIPKGEENVQREICMLKRMKHINVIDLVDVITNNEREKIYIVMGFCVCSMHEMLQHAPGNIFPEWQAHVYFSQLINGLHYLHSIGVVHKDLKPSNLLLTTDETLKISDFGVAEQLDPFAVDDSCVASQGSPMFQPPEIANGVDTFSGFKLDVWATGVTLFNITTGKYPYEGKNIYELFINIGKGDLILPSELDHSLSDLLSGLLCTDYLKRFTVSQIQDHVWFRKKYYKIGERIKLPNLDLETKDEGHNMTTVQDLELLNNDEVTFVQDDSGNIGLEQTPLKFQDNSNHVLVKQAAASSSETDLGKDAERKKHSRGRKQTPSSCKPQ